MRLTIDTEAKTITILEPIPFKDIQTFLNRISFKADEEYMIIPKGTTPPIDSSKIFQPTKTKAFIPVEEDPEYIFKGEVPVGILDDPEVQTC
jgi:hypothetical protein